MTDDLSDHWTIFESRAKRCTLRHFSDPEIFNCQVDQHCLPNPLFPVCFCRFLTQLQTGFFQVMLRLETESGYLLWQDGLHLQVSEAVRVPVNCARCFPLAVLYLRGSAKTGKGQYALMLLHLKNRGKLQAERGLLLRAEASGPGR